MIALDTTKDSHSHDPGQYLGRKIVQRNPNKTTMLVLNIRRRKKPLILRCTWYITVTLTHPLANE